MSVKSQQGTLNTATYSVGSLKVTQLLVNLPFMWMHNKAKSIINKESAVEGGRERGGVIKLSRHLSAPVFQFIFRDDKYFHITTTIHWMQSYLKKTFFEDFLLCLISHLR